MRYLNPNDSVLIVVSDATRATASAQIIHLLVRRIIQLGISPRDIAIIFATGIHRPVTAKEKEELLSPFILQRIRTIDHDANDLDHMISLGTTKRGIPVELNRALKDFTHVVITGGISFHYFAGFTGGRKSISPGLASASTIKQTHMLALNWEVGGRAKGVAAAALDGNPVHAECDEMAAKIAPAFGINAVVDERGRAVQIFAGDWRLAHRQACESYLSGHSLPINERRAIVIASCGGAPYDLNLIQAHKALEMSTHACRDGGAIVLLAECADGLGRSDFLKWFDGAGSRSLETRLKTGYEVNGQTAWALLTKTERYRVFLVSSLPDDDVTRMGMVPCRTLADAMRNLPPQTDGYILPRGAAYLPVLRG